LTPTKALAASSPVFQPFQAVDPFAEFDSLVLLLTLEGGEQPPVLGAGDAVEDEAFGFQDRCQLGLCLRIGLLGLHGAGAEAQQQGQCRRSHGSCPFILRWRDKA
jgi:hypothetical protein